MTISLEKSCSFGLLCAPFAKLLYNNVFSYFPFGFEGRIWDLILSVPDHFTEITELSQRSFHNVTPGYNHRNAETLENGEKVFLKIKGSNSTYIRNDNLNYISPLKVFNNSVCLKVSLTFSENQRNNIIF